MSNDYKYTLTRICLRSGQLSLTQSMVAMFPEAGTITALDAEKNTEFELQVEKRRINGLSKFFQTHHLDVNDEIHISAIDDTHFLFAPLKRNQRPPEKKGSGAGQLAEKILLQGVPLAESEIKALFPELTKSLDVHGELSRDNRLELKAGRWQQKTYQQASLPEQAQAEAEPLELLSNDQGSSKPAETPRQFAEDLETPSVTSYRTGPKTPKAGLASATQYEDLDGHNRARDLLKQFGYRVDVLDSGQLLAHADLGRHNYSVYVHVLPEHSQLDWSTLLTRRRDTNASYGAVFGDHRDLLRLGAPAGMARATLWSWSGLARVKDLMQVVPISPYDLESHFEKDGLFEQGKERFEKTIGDRVAERGVFSSVLSRLAGMRSPCIFMLDDVVDEQLSREQVLKVLENLSGAPFHMIAKVGNGEFCLRNKVSESLEHISKYALSLRERLPNRNTERLHAYSDGAAVES